MARLGSPLEPQYFEANGDSLGRDGTEEENASFRGPRWACYHQTKLANAAFHIRIKKEIGRREISIIPLFQALNYSITAQIITSNSFSCLGGICRVIAPNLILCS